MRLFSFLQLRSAAGGTSSLGRHGCLAAPSSPLDLDLLGLETSREAKERESKKVLTEIAVS